MSSSTEVDFEAADREAVRELSALVRDLYKPNLAIYWADLAGCLLIWAIGLYISRPFPDKILSGAPEAFVGTLLSVLALYRASYFNHELSHHPKELRNFSVAWNLGIGVPLLIPSFLYTDHLNHHSVKNFATHRDVEYFIPRLRGIRGAALLLGACFFLPFIYSVRFLVLPPIAWISPKMRYWVDTRMSSLGILGLSFRKPPNAAEVRMWRLQELACFGYLVLASIALMTDLLPATLLFQTYFVIVFLLFLHGMRITVGHRYEVNESKDRIDQVLDSYNFTGNPLAASLLAPLGFRLHGLHHLFPKIPYHNMPEAHRRITTALPPGSFYHRAEAKSYFLAVANFVFRDLNGGLRTPPASSRSLPDRTVTEG